MDGNEINEKAKELRGAQEDLNRAIVSLAHAKRDRELARIAFSRCDAGFADALRFVEDCRKLVAKAERAITGEPAPKSETHCGPRPTS